MFRETVAGVTLLLLLWGTAQAREIAAAGSEEGTRVMQAAEENPVPVQPPQEAGPKEAEENKEQQAFEYKFGLAGFLRGEGVGNYRFSDYSYRPENSEGRLLYRVKPYLAWNPADFFGVTVEGQWYGFTGKGPDNWWFSLYQGYLDLRLPGSDLLALRAGRQEFSYGSTFMLGPDSFYNGLSFDAGRLRVQPTSTLTVDLLGGRYASPSADGIFGNLFGVYASLVPAEGRALEAYFFSDQGSVQHHPAEVLQSIGLRGLEKVGPLSVEIEPVYQFGETFNGDRGVNDDISAYGGHLDLSAELKTGKLRHKFWLGYALGSGSSASANGVTSRREFRNPNNDSAIFGDMNVVGDLSGVTALGHHASGLSIYNAGWGIDLTPALNFSANGHYFRVGAAEPGFSRDLGGEADFCVTYTFSENYALLLAYDRFFTGRFFRDASGSQDDVHYGYAMLQFNLEKSKLKPAKPGK